MQAKVTNKSKGNICKRKQRAKSIHKIHSNLSKHNSFNLLTEEICFTVFAKSELRFAVKCCPLCLLSLFVYVFSCVCVFFAALRFIFCILNFGLFGFSLWPFFIRATCAPANGCCFVLCVFLLCFFIVSDGYAIDARALAQPQLPLSQCFSVCFSVCVCVFE